MAEQLYPKERKVRDTSHRRYHVRYDLVYDGGGDPWTGHYRTNLGARIAAWWNVHVFSWGGKALLIDTEKE